MTDSEQAHRIRVGVLINHRATLGLHLAQYLDAHGGIDVLFYSHSGEGAGMWSRLGRWLRRNGWRKTTNQVLGRIYRRVFFGAREKVQLAELVDADAASDQFPEHVKIVHVPNVASEEMEAALREADLDVLCVMCKEMLPARLLDIPRQCVIGQHPGITPHYRGSWSSFWALANDEPNMIGTSVFLMDEKADTGEVIYQDYVEIDYSWDTFFSLSVRSQLRSAVLMARALDDLRQDHLVSKKLISDRKKTYYPVPGLTDFLKYRKKLRLAAMTSRASDR